MEVCIINRSEEKKKLLRALQTFAAEHQLPEKVLQAADLALEEHVTNIINYAYVDSATHEILVRLNIIDAALQIEVEDDGKAFNPLTHPAPDVSLPLEQRPVGGLGIHLIRKFMDEAGYRRERGRNILRLRKNLSPAAGSN